MRKDSANTSSILGLKMLYKKHSDSWILTAQQHAMLSSWLAFSLYKISRALDFIEFGRNIFSHIYGKETETGTLLGMKEADYIPEAVSVLYQHSFSRFLPLLHEELWNYYEQTGMLAIIDSIRFDDLFTGVPSWALTDGVTT